MDRAGYTPAEAKAIKDDVTHFVAVKNEVEVGAGENIDMKQFEAGMRALLDTYIQADPWSRSRPSQGPCSAHRRARRRRHRHAARGHQEEPRGGRRDDHQNVRKTIVDERAMNPKYYDRMSLLLDAIIEQRRQDAIEYADLSGQAS